jgi:hypothetical protein
MRITWVNKRFCQLLKKENVGGFNSVYSHKIMCKKPANNNFSESINERKCYCWCDSKNLKGRDTAEGCDHERIKRVALQARQGIEFTLPFVDNTTKKILKFLIDGERLPK